MHYTILEFFAQGLTVASLRDRMEKALDTLGWSSQQLARHLSIRETAVRQWQNGRRDVPANVLDWLEDRAKRLAHAPDLPAGWKRGED